MMCPRCHTRIGPDSNESEGRGPGVRSCPECGARLHATVTGFLKTSAVMISADGEEVFYNSVREVPEPLRRKLMESTSSENSATIVIADRAGKEQLTQVFGRRQAAGSGGSAAGNTAEEHAGHEAAKPAGEALGEALEDIGIPDPPVPTRHSEDAVQLLSREQMKRVAWIGFFAVLGLGAAFAVIFGARF